MGEEGASSSIDIWSLNAIFRVTRCLPSTKFKFDHTCIYVDDNLSIEKGTRVPLSRYCYVLNDFRNRHECNVGISDDTECC